MPYHANKTTAAADKLLLEFIITNPGLNAEQIRAQSPDFAGQKGRRTLPNLLTRLQEQGKIKYREGGYHAVSQL